MSQDSFNSNDKLCARSDYDEIEKRPKRRGAKQVFWDYWLHTAFLRTWARIPLRWVVPPPQKFCPTSFRRWAGFFWPPPPAERLMNGGPAYLCRPMRDSDGAMSPRRERASRVITRHASHSVLFLFVLESFPRCQTVDEDERLSRWWRDEFRRFAVSLTTPHVSD